MPTPSEEEEERNADGMSESDGDVDVSEGSSFDEEKELKNGDDESESLLSDDDADDTPQFLIKHKMAVPPLPDNAKCGICGKMKPAFFGQCKHYYCCFHCYQSTYTAAAVGTIYTPSSVCETCKKAVGNYYYRPNAIQEEEAWMAANAPKKRKRFTLIDTFEQDKLPEAFVLPKVSQCTVVERGVRCKEAAYYLADHGCYTGICFAHEGELGNECPICKKDVSYYHRHDRAPLPKEFVVASNKKK